MITGLQSTPPAKSNYDMRRVGASTKMPIGWKRKFVSRALGLVAPYVIRLTGRGALRVLNYHRILDAAPDFPLDPDVISATPELFERQVALCRRHFDVLSFADLEGMVRRETRMPARPLIITFDDGYEDNHRYAYPILRQHGVSAMFFLAAEYIETDRLFWWDAVAFALQMYPGNSLRIPAAGAIHVMDLSSPQARRRSTTRVLRLMKSVVDDERRRMVEELTHATATHRHRLPRQTMTWDEVREMHAHGMEIGSHTMSHPVLSQVTDDAALDYEIAGSRRTIAGQVGAPVSVLSYPVGGPAAFDDRVKAAARRAGYSFAVTYVNGFNRVDANTDLYALNRLHLDGLTEPEFRMRLLAPHL